MSDNYTALSGVYDDLGLSAFAGQMVMQLLDYALSSDWLGSNIIDFGCGTGNAAAWLAEDRYRVTGVDIDTDMLAVAQERNSHASWHEGDILEIRDSLGKQDLVMAFDVVNEMSSLRRVQSVFESAFAALNENTLFAFDVRTLVGLHQLGTTPNSVVIEADTALMIQNSTFDFERQMVQLEQKTFIMGMDGSALRQDTERVLYGYPLQVLAALLQRVGFSDLKLLDVNLNPLTQRNLNNYRVMVIARK